MDSPSLTRAQASAITAICLLNAHLVLVESLERLYVAKRQGEDSAFASISSLMWQRQRVFFYLWIARGALSIIACLLPLPEMWREYARAQKTKDPIFALAWAANALVACIAGSIVGERLLYLGFTDALNFEQIACTITSFLAVVLLIIGELVGLVPLPIAWTVCGCALHRISILAWWYTVTHKAFASPQFQDRARLTLAGHGVAFACVFLVFLPVFRTGLNRLFWLFSVFFAVELITTAQAVRMTYSNWVTDRAQRFGPPALLPSIDLPLLRLSGQGAPPARVEIRSSTHQEEIDMASFLNEPHGGSMARDTRKDGGVRIYSPSRTHSPRGAGRH